MNIQGNKGQALRVLPAVAAFTALYIHAFWKLATARGTRHPLWLKKLKSSGSVFLFREESPFFSSNNLRFNTNAFSHSADIMCSFLSSSGIYPPSPVLRSYTTPCASFAFLLLQLSGILSLLQERRRASRVAVQSLCQTCHGLSPRRSVHCLAITALHMLTSTVPKVSSFPTRQLRGSIPSPFRITAYLLAVLRLKLTVTSQPPRTRYPVVG